MPAAKREKKKEKKKAKKEACGKIIKKDNTNARVK